MRLKFLIITVFISLILDAQQYKLSHFNSENNFAEAFVYTITQDNLGYLWIGTSNGLYRHDGFSFEYFTKKDSIANDFITASINYNGVIWLGHRTGDITTITNSVFNKINPQSVEFSSIVRFRIDSTDHLWVATYSNGLLRVSNKKEIERFSFKQTELTIQDFQFIGNNKILLGSDDGVRICQLNPDHSIEVLKYLVDIPKVKVSEILKLDSYNYLIGTADKGVYSFSIAGKSLDVNLIITPEEINNSNIASLQIDNQSGLWIGTFGYGLFRYQFSESTTIDNNSLKSFSSTISDNIKCIFQDRDENLWLGNYGSGLTKVAKNPFQKEHVSSEKFGKSVLAIESDDSLLWIGTERAVFSLSNTNELTNIYTTANGLPDDEITSLFKSKDEILWVGTLSEGLYKILPGTNRITRIDFSTGLLENSITALAGYDGFLWVGTKKGLARIETARGKIDWFTINKGGLPHNVVKDIYIDSDKKVWITTQSNTLSYFDNSIIHKIDIPSDNGVFIINAVTKDAEGNIWLASNGMGVYKIENDSVLNLREKEGLFSNYCYSIISDKRGFIWVCHRGGLSRVDALKMTISGIQKSAGITEVDEFNPNSCSIDNKGVLWFGSTNGLLSYNPKFENKEFLPPILSINSIKVNGVEREISNKIKLSSGKYKLRFEYIGISLKEPEEVKYQYRLYGYDEEWSEITSDRVATFNNLNSGHYAFEINASNSDGIITASPLRIEIVIKRALWTYWWYYLGVFMLLSFVVMSYMKRREYKLIEDKLNLEKRVKERTREIQLQHDEIQRQGELINKKNIDITDSIKYARTIQSAIFPPEEILKSALPEYFLINKPKDIVSGDFCWYTKRGDKYVVAVTDCTGHGVPGAIMSMLGITLFNEVVNNLGIINSSEILELVRDKVISALNQHRKENPSSDGMNVGLCIIDKKEHSLQYSGAFHNLVHFHKNKLNVIKAERSPIGFSPLGKPDFITHNIEYSAGDMFYLYSDGYQDQFGGMDDKKFTNRRLLNILSDVQDKPMENQKLVIEQTLSFWMQDEEQTDDIIMLGFRL